MTCYFCDSQSGHCEGCPRTQGVRSPERAQSFAEWRKGRDGVERTGIMPSRGSGIAYSPAFLLGAHRAAHRFRP